MNMQLQLKIWETSQLIAHEFLNNIGQWLKIAFLPWVLGTWSIISVEQFFANNFPTDPIPWWLEVVVLAPFSAMIFVTILKNLMYDAPVRFLGLDLSQSTLLATLVMAILGLTSLFTDYLFIQCLLLAGPDFFSEEAPYYIPPDSVRYLSLSIVRWIVDAAIIAASYMVFAAIVEHNQLRFRLIFALVRRHFWGLLGIVILFSVAIRGFEHLYFGTFQLFNVDIGELRPTTATRPAALSSAKSMVIWFPVDFLSSVLPPIGIGIIYRAYKKHGLI